LQCHRRDRIAYRIGVLSVLIIFGISVALQEVDAVVPPNFSDTLIAQGLNLPTKMEISPDGHMIFVSEKCGNLRVIEDEVLLAQPFESISVDCNGFDIGLLGIAFDPNYDTNGYVYVYYTPSELPWKNRISRFTTDPANHHLALVGSEFILLDSEPLITDSHTSGEIEFGSDGTLFIAMGDSYQPQLAPDLTTRFGKILRINSDGTIPTDNPHIGVPGAYPEIWASGLRNPFTFQISSTGTMYIADVGQAGWEEFNEGLAGADYGWPSCEGPCSTPPFVDPVYAYPHPGCPGCTVVGGAASIAGPFYEGTQFPSIYQDSFFFADYVEGYIKRLTPTNQVIDFASGIGSPVGMEEAPDGSLYYLTIVPGQIHKITYDLANGIPTAVATANPTFGQPPLFVTFDGSGSSDPDGDPLTYSWDYGDGSPVKSGVSVTHNYNSVGAFTAVLTVDDGNGGVATGSIVINIGNPPVGTIDTPTVGTLYNGGDTILFSGSASDIEDGTLPASAYEWTVVFHHNTHTHPYLQFSGVTSGSFDIDTQNETAPDVWYRVFLTVTDSDGLSLTTFQDVLPNTVNITVDTDVAGLQILVDSQPQTAPYSFEGVVGITRTLEAPTSQLLNGDTFDFVSWSDGGASAHTISTPATDTTYTASYVLGSATTFTLTVNTVDMLGNPFPGFFTPIYDGGTLVFTGFSPVTFTGTPGTTYTVETQGYLNWAFHHWEDGSQVMFRDVTLNSDTTITSFIVDNTIGDLTPPVVSANPTGGTFLGSVDVTLTAIDNFDPSPTIYYTLDGSPATPLSPVYSGPITITTDTTINFIAQDATGNTNLVSFFEDYIIISSDVTPPVVSASPTSGTFLNSGDVTLTATDNFDPTPTIYYTTDGTTPTTASLVYTAPITITADTTLNFMAADASGNASAVSTESYVITNTDNTPPVVSASPTGGTFAGSVVVTLSATDNFDPTPTI